MRGFLRSLRWAFGIIRPADLSSRSDLDLILLAEDFARRRKTRRSQAVLSAFNQRTTVDPRILQRYGDVSYTLGAHDSTLFSYLQAAELYLQAGTPTKAGAVLHQLVRMYPDHIDARMSLARVLEVLERNKEAAANYAVVARIFEAHGQHDACAPLLAKIAELWPPARADYQGQLPAHTPPPASSVSMVVVGEPTPPVLDDAAPIELDLQSLISTYALDEPAEVHGAPTVSIGAYDPNLLAAAGHEPSTVCAPEDPWLGTRPAIGRESEGGDMPTASYAAIDSDRTLMDMRGIDIDTARDHPTADATILDLRAIRDEGAVRVFDHSDTTADVDDLDGEPAKHSAF